MKTEDIRYCVEFVYNGPDSSFWSSKSKKFFRHIDDVSEFLIEIRDNKNDGKWCSDPVVYESNFNKWSDVSVMGMVAAFENRNKIKEQNDADLKEAAMSKLTKSEQKILGL